MNIDQKETLKEILKIELLLKAADKSDKEKITRKEKEISELDTQLASLCSDCDFTI